MPRRTLTYIDGFNLYHATDDLKEPALKWVDLWKLSETLMRWKQHAGLEGVTNICGYGCWIFKN